MREKLKKEKAEVSRALFGDVNIDADGFFGISAGSEGKGGMKSLSCGWILGKLIRSNFIYTEQKEV